MSNILQEEMAVLVTKGVGLDAINAVAKGNLFNNITTDTTTVVKSGTGTLRRIIVNKKGVTASAVVVYDNTAASGTKICSIDSLNLSGVFEFDAKVTNGITVVTTGTPDITVIYL